MLFTPPACARRDRVSTCGLPDAYDVAITGTGTVTRIPDQPSFAPNSLVAVSANPGPDFRFFNWSGDATGNTNQLNVAMTSNKTVIARFVSTVLNVAIQGQGAVNKTPNKSSYDIGEQVTMTPAPARWYSFTRWGEGLTTNPRLVTIGANNNYTAVFNPTTALETLTFSNITRTAPVGTPAVFVDDVFIPTGSVTRIASAQISILTTFANGAILYTLNGSTPSSDSILYGSPFTRNKSAVIRALAYSSDFSKAWEADPVQLNIIPTYNLNSRSAGGGSINVGPGPGPYVSNSPVNVTAVPLSGWTFLQWLGDQTGTNAVATMKMDRDKCVEAVFGTALTTTVSGAGSLAVAPSAPLMPYGARVKVTALPQSGSYFALWGNSATGTTNPLSIVLTNANPTVSSLFGTLTAGQYALTILVNGFGSVSMNPVANRFNSGQLVSIVALPDANQSFVSWSGDATGSQANLILAMTQSKTLIANFTRKPRLLLWDCEGHPFSSGLRFLLNGEPGLRYEIDRSFDLSTWVPQMTLSNSFGTLQLDRVTTSTNQGFYRAMILP